MKYLQFFAIFLLFSCSSKNNLRFSLSDDSIFDQNSFLNLTIDKQVSSSRFINDCLKDDLNLGIKKSNDHFLENQNNPIFWIDLANCYFYKADYSKAEYYLLHALSNQELTPLQKIVIQNNLGVNKFFLADYLSSEMYFLKAKSSSKVPNMLFVNLAIFYLNFGKLDSAIEVLLPLIQKFPSSQDLNYLLAHIYLFKKDYYESLHFFSKLSPEYLKNEDVILSYIILNIQKGDISKAKELFDSRTPSNDRKLLQISRNIEKYFISLVEQE